LTASRFDAIPMSWLGSGASKTMSLRSMRLRLESADGSPAKEYRIEDGNVEVRTLDPEGGSHRRNRTVWCQLTPEQLSIHVERNTVVDQWLERRLGWTFIAACVGQELSMWKVAGEHPRIYGTRNCPIDPQKLHTYVLLRPTRTGERFRLASGVQTTSAQAEVRITKAT
jgi:hypothetical protein